MSGELFGGSHSRLCISPDPDVVAMDYIRFETLENNRTRLVGHSVYPTQEARDGMAASGMEVGLSEGYARLDALLSSR